ncbi:signal recognition particle, SRP19 subunit [Dipodascopsis tothii]|uniref:signal recognition particle, SRP19 subunit n=1 Tax=Dipodascopsis tothii TaxID=44089 RepID=UPI0034CDECC8
MLEEVEDIDNMDFDPADFDPRNALAPMPVSASSASSASSSRKASQAPSPGGPGFPLPGMGGGLPPKLIDDASMFKDWQTVYPVYFDASRSQSEGRRVSKAMAVENPLAKALVEACAVAGVQVVFEPQKTHPKDWSNPGRVRINLRDPETKQPTNPAIKNKRQLYIYIAEYLKTHPTKPEDPLSLPIPGLPSDKVPEKPEVPRGWKVNAILPLHSPALSGGGVSDNIFKDLQGDGGLANMLGGMGGGGMPGMGAGGMPDLASMANMLGGMGGMGGMANMLGGMGGMGGMGGAGGAGGPGPNTKKLRVKGGRR